jgi:hypothetical protein
LERAFVAYATNYLIDLWEAVIVDVEATTAIRQVEVTAQRRLIDRTQERLGLWATLDMAMQGTCHGWSRSATTSRTASMLPLNQWMAAKVNHLVDPEAKFLVPTFDGVG